MPVASGSSVQSAESNLNIVLDVLDVRAHIESPAERELGSRQFPTLRVNRVT